jgi:hypothetical protein
VFVEISSRECKTRRQGKGFFTNLPGIYDREKGFEILAFDVVQQYDGVQRFVIAYAKTGKFGIEVSGVTRKEVSMNTIQRAIDLEYSY